MITIDTIHKYGADENKDEKIAITTVQRQSYQSTTDQKDEWQLSGISPELKENVVPLIERLDNLPEDVLKQLLGGKSALEKVLAYSDVQASLMSVTEEKVKKGDIGELRTYLNQLKGFRTRLGDSGSVTTFLDSLITKVDEKLDSVIEKKKLEEDKASAEKKKQEAIQKQEEAKKVKEEEKAKEDQKIDSNLAPSSKTTALQNSDVPVPETNYSSGNTYASGNCTWGVKSYFGSRVGDYWGNGQEWANNARNAGFVVDENPVAWNTVAVFRGGLYGSSAEYGHVAVVASVKGDEVEVYEMNVTGLGAYSYRWLPKSGLEFIHV